MAFIDYGALLKVNGKFINKNDALFAYCSDTGYVCYKATYYDKYEKKNKEDNIYGNFYVYAGDENFMLCFYKGYFYIISHNRIISTVSYNPFLSETFYLDGFPSITVERLDKNLRYEYMDEPDEYDVEYWNERLGKRRAQLLIRRLYKKRKSPVCRYYSSRWKVTWDYNENHYEVIFGYGIDNDEIIWNRIKFNSYEFSDIEREIIDEWFKGE